MIDTRSKKGRKKNTAAKTTGKKTPKARASWRGMLRFGLVAFPVQAFNAHLRDEGAIAFHQLHAQCHSRIRHEKVCPVHGPVELDEIISGFEYSPGKYIEVEPDELDALRSEREKALTIDSFIAADELDPIYFDGRMYYLAPDGEAARESYVVFLQALARQDRVGVGQVVFSGKDQIALIRPYGEALHMALLNYPAEIRHAAQVIPDLPAVRGGDRKVALAEKLVATWGEQEFDFSTYIDQYHEKVKQLIEAKVEGRELVAPEAEEEPQVINLMDALRKSLARTKNDKAKPASNRLPRRRTAIRRRAK